MYVGRGPRLPESFLVKIEFLGCISKACTEGNLYVLPQLTINFDQSIAKDVPVNQ